MRRALVLGAFAGGLLTIVILSLLPKGIIHFPWYLQDFGHALAYGLMALILTLEIKQFRQLSIWLVLLGFLSLGLEVSQLLVSGRTASVIDFLLGLLGLVLGAGIGLGGRAMFHLSRKAA